MKQRALVETGRLNVLDHQRAGGEGRRQIGFRQKFCRQHARAGRLRQIVARWLLPEPCGPTVP